MFALTYRLREDKNISTCSYFNDIKDLGQALINIVDNEKEEQSAMEWCGRAYFGDKVVRQQFGYKIECFRETELQQNLQKIADEISKISGVENEFIGWDNESLTWDFAIGVSFMKFSHSYGYYMVINLVDEDGGSREVWTTTDRDVKRFMSDSANALRQFSDVKTKADKEKIADARKRSKIDSWPNNSSKPKYDITRRAEEYSNRFGIKYYRVDGYYLIYNQSFKTTKQVNGRTKQTQFSIQHKVDLRDYTESTRQLKRTDTKGFENVH